MMTDEIELKLELSPADADRLIGSELFANDAKVAKLVSTYFDTSAHAVAKAGYSLRIRRSGKTRIQTIKADGPAAAGLFVRTEWERAVDGDVPVLDHTTPLPTVLGADAAALAPLFEVKVERSKWTVVEEGTKIEVVLDRGDVVSGDRSEPICEIELELIHGDPSALFGFARKIDAVVPVHLGAVTKSERGYRLDAPELACIKAEPLALNVDVRLSDAFKRAIHACIRHFRLNEALLVKNRDAHALHQARVAVRRMRSAFSIFKPMIGDDGAALRDELKWLASILGNARDLDVLLGRASPGPLYDRLTSAREQAYDDLFGTLAGQRARVIMLDVAHWVSQGRWNDGEGGDVDGAQPAKIFAADALSRFRRRIKRRGKNLASADDAARHDVRKDAKKLRYASEFFTSLFSRKREQRRQKRFVAALEGLQDRLGALNDLATAPAVLKRLGWGDEVGAAELLAGNAGKKKLLRRADDAYDELFDTKKFW